MGLLELISVGLEAVWGIEPIGWMLLGTFLGIIVGATPGLSSGMAVALLLPITFAMSPLNALIFLTSTYVAVTYGGSLTAILLNTPGAPENAATALDGYPMTQQGRASEALGTAIMSSALGGLFSYLMLLVGIGALAAFALRFGPPELFLVALMGIAILGTLGSGSPLKVLASGVFGLMLGTIGLVPTGEWRATFDSLYLVEGMPVVPVLIGLFVVTELLVLVGREYVVQGSSGSDQRSFAGIRRGFAIPFRNLWTVIRSGPTGMLVGMVPAAGGTLAAFASYALAKRASKEPDSFGKGNPQGIVAAESANNACSGGALMTTMVLGVPGSVATAVLLGAMTMHDLRAGPQLVHQQIPVVYGLIMAAIISQVFMVAMATGAGYAMTGALSVRTRILVPILMVFSVLGAFGLRNATFDVYLMLGFGLLGFLMRYYDYSPTAVVMGVILGPIADNELIRTLQLYRGDWFWSFFERPVAFVLLVILVGSLSIGSYKAFRGSREKRRRQPIEPSQEL